MNISKTQGTGHRAQGKGQRAKNEVTKRRRDEGGSEGEE